MFRLAKIFLNPRISERNPILIALLGFFYASLSLLLSIWLFPDYASMVMVFLSTISCLYVVQKAIIIEEKIDQREIEEKSLLKAHSRVIVLFLFLFLGFLAAFVLWTITLPHAMSALAFNAQTVTVHEIQTLAGTGSAITQSEPIVIILENNLRVLVISILFAFFYGAGAVFILAWNASVMGFVIGNLARNAFGLSALPIIFTKYFLHGIFEMGAYFIGALAGGILFIALIKGDLNGRSMRRTLFDIFVMLLISVALLIVAALIETHISTLI